MEKFARQFVFNEIPIEEFSDIVHSSFAENLEDNFINSLQLLICEYDRGHWTELQLKLEVAKLLLGGTYGE